MKTLHFYLLRQVVASLVLTVAVFTFVLLLGNVLKEVLVLLVSGRASFWMVAKSIGLLIPFVWVFALPMGMLTATLLTFGRFSADQELTAARASGVSLLSLIAPILLLSVALSGFSAWVTMDLGPRSRVAYKHLIEDVMAEGVTKHLPARRYIKDFPNHIFYIDENEDGNLSGIWAWVFDEDGFLRVTVNASSGNVSLDMANQQMLVELVDASTVIHDKDGISDHLPHLGGWTIPLDLNISGSAHDAPSITDMTFWELRQELEEIRTRMGAVKWAENVAGEIEVAEAQQILAKMEIEMTTPLRVQLHRQVSFSFACIGFTLIGIPLGIRVHRRETNVGMAVGLVLVLVYYSFFILGQSLEMDPQYLPHLILWVPNFLFQCVGGLLLWRANRGV